MNKQGNFTNHIEMKIKINLTCTFIQILQIRQSIPLEWRNITNKESINENNIDQKLQINLCGTLKPITKISCKDYYWHIINKAKHEPTAKTKWSDIYNEFKEVDNDIWKRIIKMSFNTCRETKIQTFQYRIIHRTIPCNKWLFNIKIKSEKNL